MHLDKAVNNFFEQGYGRFNSHIEFENSLLGTFYKRQFGELVFTEDTSLNFIGVDKNYNHFDEIYYSKEIHDRVGTLIPKIFLENDYLETKVDPVWKDVAEKGYADLGTIGIDRSLKEQALDEAYIPFGVTEGLGVSKSFSQAYFFSQGDYINPEKHRSPSYLDDVTRACLQFIPKGNPILNHYKFHTADLVKYVYDESDLDRLDPPNVFHFDHFPRCMYMFFIYFSKKSPIVGRELGVGKRRGFQITSHNDISLFDEKEHTLERVTYEDIPIADGKVILVNTLNPSFVHRVNKLRHDNEVTLISNYFWSEDFKN